MTKPPKQPQPNITATLRGNSTFPWITLRGPGLPLIAMIGTLNVLLSAIDGGLEVLEADDGLGLRVQPKPGLTRTRPELFAATRRLAQTQSEWRVKWEDD